MMVSQLYHITTQLHTIASQLLKSVMIKTTAVVHWDMAKALGEAIVSMTKVSPQFSTKAYHE